VLNLPNLEPLDNMNGRHFSKVLNIRLSMLIIYFKRRNIYIGRTAFLSSVAVKVYPIFGKVSFHLFFDFFTGTFEVLLHGHLTKFCW